MLLPTFLLLPLLSATPPERVELIFGGDIIPHGGVKEAAAAHALRDPGGTAPSRSLNHEGWDHVFESTAEVLRSADIAMVNLETPISGDKRARLAELLFDGPPALPLALAAAGVDVVSIANNHAYDQHRTGVQATWSHLDQAGVQHVGSGTSEAAAWEPLILERNGIRVGLLSITRWLNGFHNPEPDVAPYVAYVPYLGSEKKHGLDTAPAVELVRAAARRCDALIVAIHWGIEYSHTPSPEDRALAQAFLEAGAIAIVGHHPHVLQPIEPYRTSTGRDTLIAFSLGNLVANQDWQYTHGGWAGKNGRKRDSLLLRFALTRSQPGAAVTLDGMTALPVWIDNNRSLALRTRKTRNHLQPVLLDEELRALNSRLEAFPARTKKEPPALRLERIALERRLDLVQHRRDIILRTALPRGAGAPRVESVKPSKDAID